MAEVDDLPTGARTATTSGDPAAPATAGGPTHAADAGVIDQRPGPDDEGPGVDAGGGDAGGGDVTGRDLTPGAGGPDLRADAERRRMVRTVVDVVVVAACAVFVLWHLQPDVLLADTTPAGGDMGAHVWGPAYLRDTLLPNGQVAGWTGDWYAGFPAYQFYMVVPSLVIVALNAGVHGWLGLVPAIVGLAGVVVAVARWPERRTRGVALAVAGAGLALVGLPYGVAFKLTTVSGLVLLPVAAYAFGRLARVRFPGPAVLAAATLPFIFYRGYTIYGGNAASTLAGEFAFSMSLTLAVVYLGVVFRGLETGRHRALAAVLLAATGLCHLIPAFWALGATALAVAVRFRPVGARLSSGLPLLVGGLGGLVVGAVARGLVGDGPVATAGLVVAGLGAVAVVAGLWWVSDSVRWTTPVMVVGGLLSMWWVGPFYLRQDYLNDMGWEKLPYADPDLTRFDEWRQHLMPYATPDVDLRWVFALALFGGALCLVLRVRAGVFLLLSTLAVGVAFVVTPEGRLWNGRLLPFYYLSAMLLAGLTVSETTRLVARLVRDGRREPAGAGAPVALGVLAAVVVVVGVPLGQLPFTRDIDNGVAWPRFSPVEVRSTPASFIPSWARWNYSGYERKDSYREYHDIVRTMADLGEQEGCGRAFWEYEKELDRYGTPMALMLLPFWTDGCIGSMEGLYFEASATTPFHFLTQVELSTAPSAAQRDLPYGGFDITRGVQHLQMMGVRYYMATSENAVTQARTNPDLTEVASSGPWVVFEVADSDVVTPLDNQPAVVEGIDDSQLHWVEEPLDESGRFGGPAVRWFTEPERWGVPLASSGPDGWERVSTGGRPEAVPLDPVEVSDVEVGEEGISFDVDRVDVPVLVKVSYFPNWTVSGADGPYRVAPNFMVVVPNDTHVELSYGRTGVEWFSYLLTLAGVVGLVALVRRPRMAFAPGDPVRDDAHGQRWTDDGTDGAQAGGPRADDVAGGEDEADDEADDEAVDAAGGYESDGYETDEAAGGDDGGVGDPDRREGADREDLD